MNKKEELNLNKFRRIIEKRKFDEYDIMAFLITIRAYLKKGDTPLIYDFADGIAHRKRDRGNAFESIMNSAQNKYVISEYGKVEKYNGMDYEGWKNEWNIISKLFDIKITPIIISEITLCIFSIFQFTEFEYNEGQIKKNPEYKVFKGIFELLIDENSNLHLTTLESKAICFGRLDDVEVEEKFKSKFFFEPVETIRIKKRLYLQCNGEKVLYVKKLKNIHK